MDDLGPGEESLVSVADGLEEGAAVFEKTLSVAVVEERLVKERPFGARLNGFGGHTGRDKNPLAGEPLRGGVKVLYFSLREYRLGYCCPLFAVHGLRQQLNGPFAVRYGRPLRVGLARYVQPEAGVKVLKALNLVRRGLSAVAVRRLFTHGAREQIEVQRGAEQLTRRW